MAVELPIHQSRAVTKIFKRDFKLHWYLNLNGIINKSISDIYCHEPNVVAIDII